METLSSPTLFTNCSLSGIALKTLEPIYKDKYDKVRLYVVKDYTFGALRYEAALIEFFSASSDTTTMWDSDEELVVSAVFTCSGNYFDGCKHIIFGDDDYLYYPPIEDIAEALKIINSFHCLPIEDK